MHADGYTRQLMVLLLNWTLTWRNRCLINTFTLDSQGSCAYDASEDCLRWTIKNFPSEKEFFLRANLHLPSVKAEDVVTGRGPPINIKFEIPYNVPSGLQVRYFKVFERSNYAALPWVRYITRSGNYDFRLP